MPIFMLIPKGQITIPKDIQKASNWQSSKKVIIVVESNQTILRSLKGKSA